MIVSAELSREDRFTLYACMPLDWISPSAVVHFTTLSQGSGARYTLRYARRSRSNIGLETITTKMEQQASLHTRCTGRKMIKGYKSIKLNLSFDLFTYF